MTIVGNLSRDNAQKLSSFMSIEPQIRLWDILQTKFKAKALQEKVYIEYDKVKADTWDRRNMRVEFNPNKLTHEEMIWLKQNIIDYMEDDGFTRLDLAFDFEDDLIHTDDDEKADEDGFSIIAMWNWERKNYFIKE